MESNSLPIQQFKQITLLQYQLSQSYSTNTALSNPSHNRYLNILPYDHNLIQLPNSHYINASRIQPFSNSIKNSHHYIATQGPLPHTIHTFWSMIWQESSRVILNLTVLNEGNRVKCSKYWPDVGMEIELSDGMSLMVTKVDEMKSVVEYTFVLKKDNKVKSGRIIHYINWPDHGVPSDYSDVVYLIQRVNELQAESVCGPAVIHCSAGVGRTGTFCAIDIALKDITLELYDIVAELRKYRVRMVESLEQYEFCLRVIEHMARKVGDS